MQFWAIVFVAVFIVSIMGGARANSDALLNQYYAAKKESPIKGLDILEAAVKQYPKDVRIHAEIGYHALYLGNKRRALRAFRRAVELAPARADYWRQIGYIEIDLENFDRAVEAFLQARRINPKDEQVTMQIGHLQHRLGQNRAAAESFRSVLNSADENRARQACGAYQVVRGVPNKWLPKPWFAESYMAPEYRTHYDIGILPIEGRVGASFGTTTVIDAYASLRGTRDSRSGLTNFGPLTYYDNAAILAGGLRFKPHTDLPFFLFVETGAAYDLVDRNRERWRSDVRGGMVAYKQWNMDPPCRATSLFPFRLVADAYAEAIYYSRYDGDVLFYGRARPGFRLFETPVQAVDGYLLGAVNSDTRGVNDNRFQEFGAGLALHAYDPIRWTVRAELVNVWRREADGYLDFRLRLEHQVRF